MSRINKIWTDLKGLATDAEVLSYWDNQQSRILENLRTMDSDFETAIDIIHRLARFLNDREKYSSIYYLYRAGFQPIEDRLPPSDNLNELKFELGRGLHHNRKYDHSKRLFNEIASRGFDTSRIDGWWDQTAFASTRERVWVKTGVLPALGGFLIMLAYIFTVMKMEEFLIPTVIFTILFEVYQAWWRQYRVKVFEGNPEAVKVEKRLKNKVLIGLGISLLSYPIYLLKQEWLLPLVLITAVYFQGFHYGLNYYYLPRLIGELNRRDTMH